GSSRRHFEMMRARAGNAGVLPSLSCPRKRGWVFEDRGARKKGVPLPEMSLSKKAVRSWYNSQRWKKKAKYQLQQHTLCAMCLGIGRITAATTADHIVPHRGDAEAFWRGTLQSLCTHHHSPH